MESQSYGASPAIWDHTVLPATRHRWARPAITPATHAGTRFTYPGGMEGWVYLVTRKRSRRESNSRPLGPESNALTTEPLSNILQTLIDSEGQFKVKFYAASLSVAHVAWAGSRHREPKSTSRRDVRRCGSFRDVFDLRWPRPFELKIGSPALPNLGNASTNCVFSTWFGSRVMSRYVTETDRRTDGRAWPLMRPVRTTAQ